MNSDQKNRYFLRAMAILGVVMAVTFPLVSFHVMSSYPERDVLTRVEGAVTAIASSRYAIDFRLAEESRTFSYAHKRGDWQRIDAALRERSGQPIVIWIDADEHAQGTGGASDHRFQVYEISNKENVLRTYDEILQSWRDDHQFIYLLVPLCLLAAGFLEYRARQPHPI